MLDRVSTPQIAARVTAALLLCMLLLFGSAGTVNWPEAWLFILLYILFVIPMMSWLKKNNPELLRERLNTFKRPKERWDRILMVTGIPISLALLIVPGLDAVRFRCSSMPLPPKLGGFLGILISLVLLARVMRENAFLSRIVEVQTERGHKVITTGPYAFIRHPMYAALIVFYVSIALALGSLYALIPALLLAALIVVRTALEDKTLHRELEGYQEYARRVRYRLLPGFW